MNDEKENQIIRDMLKHENELIKDRIGWSTVAQSFLFATLGLLCSNSTDACKHFHFEFWIPTLGIFIALTSLWGVSRAFIARNRIYSNYHEKLNPDSTKESTESEVTVQTPPGKIDLMVNPGTDNKQLTHVEPSSQEKGAERLQSEDKAYPPVIGLIPNKGWKVVLSPNMLLPFGLAIFWALILLQNSKEFNFFQGPIVEHRVLILLVISSVLLCAIAYEFFKKNEWK